MVIRGYQGTSRRKKINKYWCDPLPDELLSRFRLVAAKITLGQFPLENLMALSEQTLNQGVYHSALVSIMDLRPQTQAAVVSYLECICNDHDIPIGDTDWALRYLLVHFIARMSQSDSDAHSELVDLMHAVGPETLDRLYQNRHLLGLDRILFLGLQYNYHQQFGDDSSEGKEILKEVLVGLNDQLRIAAYEWKSKENQP